LLMQIPRVADALQSEDWAEKRVLSRAAPSPPGITRWRWPAAMRAVRRHRPSGLGYDRKMAPG
jgi:hypothetical protein